MNAVSGTILKKEQFSAYKSCEANHYSAAFQGSRPTAKGNDTHMYASVESAAIISMTVRV